MAPAIPALTVTSPPALLQIRTFGSQKVMFAGTQIVLGNYLFTTSGTTTTPPIVHFAGISLDVTGMKYSPAAQVTPIGTSQIQQGVDSLKLSVPNIGVSPDTLTGTLTVATPAGSATMTNIFYAPTPQVTGVQLSAGGQFQPVTNSTLFRGKTYRITGNALKLVAGGTNIGQTTFKLNGLSMTVATLSGTNDLVFTVPSTATTGPLVVSTEVGSKTVGTFTVSDPVAGVSIVGLQLSPGSVTGGTGVTATVAVDATIPAGGSAGNIVFSSGDSSVVVPSGLVAVTSNPVVVQLSTKVVASARTAQIIVHNEPTATQTSPMAARSPSTGTRTTAAPAAWPARDPASFA